MPDHRRKQTYDLRNTRDVFIKRGRINIMNQFRFYFVPDESKHRCILRSRAIVSSITSAISLIRLRQNNTKKGRTIFVKIKTSTFRLSIAALSTPKHIIKRMTWTPCQKAIFPYHVINELLARNILAHNLATTFSTRDAKLMTSTA